MKALRWSKSVWKPERKEFKAVKMLSGKRAEEAVHLKNKSCSKQKRSTGFSGALMVKTEKGLTSCR
jgi:hypothetical protein